MKPNCKTIPIPKFSVKIAKKPSLKYDVAIFKNSNIVFGGSLIRDEHSKPFTEDEKFILNTFNILIERLAPKPELNDLSPDDKIVNNDVQTEDCTLVAVQTIVIQPNDHTAPSKRAISQIVKPTTTVQEILDWSNQAVSISDISIIKI